MLNSIKLLCLTVIFSLTQCAQAPANGVLSPTHDELKIEVVVELPIEELWWLLPPTPIKSKHEGSISVWEYDRESFPYDGVMKASLLIVAGLGDIMEIPVAVKVWVPIEDKIVYDIEQTKERQLKSEYSLAVFCNKEVSAGNNEQKWCVEMSIHHSGDVYFNQKLIGAVKSVP